MRFKKYFRELENCKPITEIIGIGKNYYSRYQRKWLLSLRQLILIPGLLPAPALAVDWSFSGARVVYVEPTYMPSEIRFALDQSVGACLAGSTLHYFPTGTTDQQRAQNAAAVLAVLLSGKMTLTSISGGGNNAGCVATYIISA